MSVYTWIKEHKIKYNTIKRRFLLRPKRCQVSNNTPPHSDLFFTCYVFILCVHSPEHMWGSEFNCPSLPSVPGRKRSEKKTAWGELGLVHAPLPCYRPSLREVSGGTWRRESKPKPWRNAAAWLALRGLLGFLLKMFSFI